LNYTREDDYIYGERRFCVNKKKTGLLKKIR